MPNREGCGGMMSIRYRHMGRRQAAEKYPTDLWTNGLSHEQI